MQKKIWKLLLLVSMSSLSLCMKGQNLIRVQGGELPDLKLKVKDFYIDKYEVTVASFANFIEKTGYVTDAEQVDSSYVLGEKRYEKVRGVNWRHDIYGKPIAKELYESIPVARVSVNDAQAYAKWAKKRLPTAAEWEFAARGGSQSVGFAFSGSNKANAVAWFHNNAYGEIQPVGKKNPNELGIHDMSGNVFEFCLNGGQWEVRGGSFFSDKEAVELGNWGYDVDPTYSFPTYGFRCVKDGE